MKYVMWLLIGVLLLAGPVLAKRSMASYAYVVTGLDGFFYAKLSPADETKVVNVVRKTRSCAIVIRMLIVKDAFLPGGRG